MREFNPARDYYQLLGVDRQANAGQIKRAFRAGARMLHPDFGGSEAAMRDLNEAYEVLRNPSTRKAYDNDNGLREKDRGSDSNPRPVFRTTNLGIPRLDADLLWLTTRGVICALLAGLWLIAAEEVSLLHPKRLLLPWLARGVGIATLGIGILFGYSAHRLAQQKMRQKTLPRPERHLLKCRTMFRGVMVGFAGLLILSMYLSK